MMSEENINDLVKTHYEKYLRDNSRFRSDLAKCGIHEITPEFEEIIFEIMDEGAIATQQITENAIKKDLKHKIKSMLGR